MRRPHRSVPLAAALVLLSTATALGRTGSAPSSPMPTDSVLDEFRVGRYWHIARALRAEGAADADPDRVLLLARAEAGWGHWRAVVELLEGREWLEREGGGEGHLLLGRAREEAGRWGDAAESYAAYLELPTSPDVRRSALLARLARARAASGDAAGAVDALDAIASEDVTVRSWAAADLARSRSEAGDTAALGVLMPRVIDAQARAATWRLVPDARLAAGDSGGAEAGYRGAMEWLRGSGRSEAATEAGLLTLARGDSAAARELLLEGFEDGSIRSRARAAGGLQRLGGGDLDHELRMASVFDRVGDGSRALRAYDRAARLADGGAAGLPGWARLSRARLAATVRDRQDEAIEEFRAIHASTEDAELGARNLEIWMALRQRQGRRGDVNTLRGWLLERFPGSAQAADILWARADSADGRGDLASALKLYEELAERGWSLARAGQARMRIAQVHFDAGRLESAAEVWERYLADFPEGRRWEEASYWAARARWELGDTAGARARIDRLREREPVSYYAVMGAALVGEPYDMVVPPGDDVASVGWLTEGLRRLDLLMDAGLERGADAEEARLIGRARDSREITLSLAEALIERGRTVAGINLGWGLRGEGRGWDRRLLQVVYPFPYRELVQREAAEWGVDPILLAALIRQESAFKADIVSHAGAVGLMQVMPATGRDLARTYGPEPFSATNLTTPEVNLHLGAAFFVEMSARYGGDLPVVLSAYNAGPTRATRWRRYPEVSDPVRFTEKIPFDETRGYVKNVRRNVGLYRILYGDQ